MMHRSRWSDASPRRFAVRSEPRKQRGRDAALHLGVFGLLVAMSFAAAPVPPPSAAMPITPINPTAAIVPNSPSGGPRMGPRGSATTANGWLQQSFSANGVTATFAIPGDSIPAFGFIPVRVSIDNTQARDFRWQADFTLTSFSVGSTEAETARSLAVPAGRGSERWIFVPTADAGTSRNYRGYYSTYGSFSVALSGPGISTSRLIFSSSGPRANSMIPWAVSNGLESAVRARIGGLTTSVPARLMRVAGRGGSRMIPNPTAPPMTTQPMVPGAPNLTAFDLTQPYGDARIFSPFSRFVMGEDEYASLLPVTKAALRNWVALGGSLHLAPDLPRAGRQEVVGAGRIVHLVRPIKDEADDGQGLFASTGLFEQTPAVPNAGDLQLQTGALAAKVSVAKRVGDWLIYFFIGFAALVAPVNLLLIAPVKRRHWLFFSLPGISATAVVILIGAIYLQDGVSGEGARRALVVLLPGDNAAAVFQDQIARTGLLTKTSFVLPEDTICASLSAEDSNFQPGRALRYDRQDGTASGDWFRGRARQAQHLRRIVPTRARLERIGETKDGAPIVQSSVDGVLRDLIYVDAKGESWTAPQVAPGVPVTLKRLAGTGDYARHVDEFATATSVHLHQVVMSATMTQIPGRFIALATPGELAPIPTLASINWRDSEVLMTGVVAGAPAAGGAR
jgi:hypothetical protein